MDLDKRPASQESQGFIADRIDRLINKMSAKSFLILFYLVLFLAAFGIGSFWGNLVVVPNPEMRDLPLYPNAQAVTDLEGRPIDVPTTPPDKGTGSFTNFKFQTADPPEAVIDFYRASLSKLYYYERHETQVPNANTKVLISRREELRGSWVWEQVTVRASKADNLTVVQVTLALVPSR